MLINCPECNTQVSPEARECPKCGQPNPGRSNFTFTGRDLPDQDAPKVSRDYERFDTEIKNNRSSLLTATRLLPGEAEDIFEEFELVVPDSKRWINSPNDLFGGRKPRDLIGTDEEEELRNVIRAIKNGIFS